MMTLPTALLSDYTEFSTRLSLTLLTPVTNAGFSGEPGKVTVLSRVGGILKTVFSLLGPEISRSSEPREPGEKRVK